MNVHLLSAKPDVVRSDQIQEWLHTEGIPAFAVMPTSDALMMVDQARDAWIQSASMENLVQTSSRWSTQEWVYFIESLPRLLDADRLRALDLQMKLTDSPNAEIAFAWFRLAIANRYADAFPAMERYMIRIGRRKFIVPLYRDLLKTPDGKALAISIFGKARDGYHPLAQSAIDELLREGTT